MQPKANHGDKREPAKIGFVSSPCAKDSVAPRYVQRFRLAISSVTAPATPPPLPPFPPFPLRPCGGVKYSAKYSCAADSPPTHAKLPSLKHVPYPARTTASVGGSGSSGGVGASNVPQAASPRPYSSRSEASPAIMRSYAMKAAATSQAPTSAPKHAGEEGGGLSLFGTGSVGRIGRRFANLLNSPLNCGIAPGSWMSNPRSSIWCTVSPPHKVVNRKGKSQRAAAAANADRAARSAANSSVQNSACVKNSTPRNTSPAAASAMIAASASAGRSHWRTSNLDPRV
mmetsp:Transcript_63259/g.183270  ORF Transcript_63259/g.183270 Transcript_63259/m.183270 type:complete len:285 (-) Transcript_63259:21-875(-)